VNHTLKPFSHLDLGGNRFRLIARVNFQQQTVFALHMWVICIWAEERQTRPDEVGVGGSLFGESQVHLADADTAVSSLLVPTKIDETAGEITMSCPRTICEPRVFG